MACLPLPLDLITDILSRLPVKTLLRFRSVSKPWCSLIDCPRFINLHLNRSLHTNSNLSLIIHSGETLSSLDFDSLQNHTQISYPFLSSSVLVVSSCNGLLLLEDEDEGVNTRITLFNPLTRKHFDIPFCDFDPPDGINVDVNDSCMLQLVYDLVGDDYKVIRLTEFEDEGKNWVGSETRVYSLKSNSWKKIKAFPYCLTSYGCVALEGGLHLLVKKYRNRDWPRVLVSIDIASEDYNTLPLPEIPDEKLVGLCLERLGNCLCLSVHTKTHDLEFWVMKEYGVGESWSKLLSIPAQLIDVPSVFFMHILAYSKCGTKILFTYKSQMFVWLDLKTGGFANIRKVHGLPPLLLASVSVNSLVRPMPAAACLPLPLDLITEILSRLPVKTLLRFRSVSKSWCSLIDCPRFINLHLNRSVHTNSNLSLIIHSGETLSSLDFDSLQNHTQISFPFLSSSALVVSSCNGLLLLEDEDERVNTRITLFNPLTRKHFDIPFCDFDRPDGINVDVNDSCMLQLVYDLVGDDYKVIRLTEFEDEGKNWVGSETRVYSLKSNSWKKIKAFPYCLTSYGCVALEGGLHLVVKKYRNRDWPRVLVSIDIVSEDYNTLPLPEIPDEKLVGLCLERLGNCLCLSVHTKTHDLEFWVMKEYGVGESWSKLLSIPAQLIDVPSVFFMHILAYSKCGTKILFTYKSQMFVWLDLKTGGFANIRKVHGLPPLLLASVSVNSLVRPMPPPPAIEETRKQRLGVDG